MAALADSASAAKSCTSQGEPIAFQTWRKGSLRLNAASDGDRCPRGDHRRWPKLIPVGAGEDRPHPFDAQPVTLERSGNRMDRHAEARVDDGAAVVGSEIVRRGNHMRDKRVPVNGDVIDVAGINPPVSVHVIVDLLELGERDVLFQMIFVAAMNASLRIEMNPGRRGEPRQDVVSRPKVTAEPIA